MSNSTYMLKKPFYHATLAAGYIVLIVNVLGYVMKPFEGPDPETGTLLVPMTMLGLFTLSAAVMAYLFGYQPIALYIDGKKQEAFRFFVHTLSFFAFYAALFVLALLYAVHTVTGGAY